MSDNTWQAWTFKISNRAYRHIRPLLLEMRPEIEYTSTGYLWWRKEFEQITGKWEVKLTYDTGPMTARKVDVVVFASENEARYWYDWVYHEVFLEQKTVVPTPPKPKMNLPETKKPSKPGLKLV